MTPTCRQIAELLIDFVENTLSVEERLTVQHHICGCMPCMIYMTTYQHTILMTRSLPEEPLPPEFEARLREVLENADKCG